jgi:hypothetical protein
MSRVAANNITAKIRFVVDPNIKTPWLRFLPTGGPGLPRKFRRDRNAKKEGRKAPP